MTTQSNHAGLRDNPRCKNHQTHFQKNNFDGGNNTIRNRDYLISLSAISFINAIKFILSGERYLPFDLASSAPAGKNHDDFTNVSAREMQTLEQLCIGLSNKEIARNLEIQEVTVKLHVKNIFSKLGVSNRTQAALFAKERHLF